MIGRAHRFHGRNGLRSVYSKGQTVRGPLCSLKFAPSRPGKGYRAAVVVSKKVSKSAVVRNRIRRRLYEALRISSLIDQPHDVVVSVFSDQLADMPADKLTQMLMSLLHQAGIEQVKTKKY